MLTTNLMSAWLPACLFPLFSMSVVYGVCYMHSMFLTVQSVTILLNLDRKQTMNVVKSHVQIAFGWYTSALHSKVPGDNFKILSLDYTHL